MSTQTPIHDAPVAFGHGGGAGVSRRPRGRVFILQWVRDRRWRNRRSATRVVRAAADGYGVAARMVDTTGRNDGTHALSAKALNVGAGVLSGVVPGARWARTVSLLTLPRFELHRLDASGATVDTIALSSECGNLSVSSEPAGLTR